MVGALVPDLVKIELGFDLISMEIGDFLAPLHHTFFQRKNLWTKKATSFPLAGRVTSWGGSIRMIMGWR